MVAIHVIGTGVSDGTTGVGMRALKMALLAAVPVFVMISGALTLDPRAHQHGPAAFLTARAVRVLPALVLWSLVYLVLVRGMLMQEDMSRGRVLELLVMGKPYIHLYFLFAIAGLYLLAPMIQSFLAPAEGRRAWVLGIAACVWTVLVSVPAQLSAAGVLDTSPAEQSAMTWPLLFAGYFILGRAMLVAPLPRWAAVSALASTPLWVALLTWIFPRGTPEYPGSTTLWAFVLEPDYTSLPVIIYSVLLMAGTISLLRDWRVSDRAARILRRVGEATFGIFLVHYAVMILLQRAVPALAEQAPLPSLVSWAATVLISTVIALLGERIPGLRRVL